MSLPSSPTATSKRVFSEPSFLRTFAVTVAAILALFAIDEFLANTELAESRAEAERLYENGRHLLAGGQPAQAVEQFKSALALARDNRDYQLALGEALLGAGRLTEAEDALSGLLERDPLSGAANLAMARVLVQDGKLDEAASYYHRAIYGQWNRDARANLVRVRFELADLLSRQNREEDLLAELLPLQQEAPDDMPTRKMLENLFLAAGSPARAAEVFQDILRKEPQDPEAHAGLGEAEFAEGNYRTARTEFMAALRLRRDDPGLRARLDLCNRILDLDPMRRGLSTEEQDRRERKLVELAAESVKHCLGVDPYGPPEDGISWAEQLWRLRKADCKQALSPDEEALDLVFAKMAR